MPASEVSRYVHNEPLREWQLAYQARIDEEMAEVAYAGDDDEHLMELQLAAAEQLEFPATMELLKDKEVWIADTGASNHTTPWKDGAINKRPSNVLTQGAT